MRLCAIIVAMAGTVLIASETSIAQPPGGPRPKQKEKLGGPGAGGKGGKAAPKVEPATEPKVEPKAAAPKTAVPTLDERLFALYAVEDLINDMRRPRGFPELKTRVVYHRLVYDILRRHVEEKNEKEWRDPEFMAIFQVYDARLSAVSQGAKELYDSMDRSQAALKRKVDEAAVQALTTGLAYSFRSAVEGDSDAMVFLTGALAANEARAGKQPEVDALKKQLTEKLTKTVAGFKTLYADEMGTAAKNFQAGVEKSKWRDNDFVFRLPKGATSRNPFVEVWRAEAFCNGAAAVPVLVKQSEECARAAETVPSGAAFDPFRTIFLSVAGRLANKAAEKDLGAVGFPASAAAAPKSGALARDIWSNYLAVEKIDRNINDSVVRQAFLASAYAGNFDEAVKTVESRAGTQSNRAYPNRAPVYEPTASYSSNPVFWYDAARVASVAGKAPFAMKCLTIAVKEGFNDADAAKFCPDLERVRTDEKTKALFNNLFEKKGRR